MAGSGYSKIVCSSHEKVSVDDAVLFEYKPYSLRCGGVTHHCRMFGNINALVKQMGVQVLRLLLQTESRIGELARAVLRDTHTTTELPERRRDVLPLPLPNSGYYIEKLFVYLNDPTHTLQMR